MAGQWRTEQVWIGGGAFGPRGADFIAPHHARVRPPSQTCWRSRDRGDVPTLPQIAVAHAQFETIHPFTDGNGRTGRALVQAMLRNKRLTRQITVPVSAGLLANTDAYFEALGSYRDGDPAPIVEQLSSAAVLAVVNGRHLVGDLRSIREQWDSRITARRDSAVHRVADLLVRQPVFNAVTLQRELGHHHRQRPQIRRPARRRPASSSSSPTAAATAPGAHPKSLAHSTHSPNAPDDATSRRERHKRQLQ